MAKTSFLPPYLILFGIVWVFASYILGLIMFLLLPDFKTSSFLVFFLYLSFLGFIVGFLASAPLLMWRKRSTQPWKKRRLLLILVIILPLLAVYRFSGILTTFFTPLPRPPEATSSYYYYRVEGGLGPSIGTGFVFSWNSSSFTESLEKAKNTAEFFDKWAKSRGYKVEAYIPGYKNTYIDKSIYLSSCKELAERKLSSSSIYFDCNIKNIIPWFGVLQLEIHDTGGTVEISS